MGEIFVKIDFELVVKMSVGFNGADLRNVCTEAGMIALREERDYVTNDDFIKSVRKMAEAKKLETEEMIPIRGIRAEKEQTDQTTEMTGIGAEIEATQEKG